MSDPQSSDNVRNFTISTEIFDNPDLDIYTQMTCIVLSSYSTEQAPPSLEQISRKGRMDKTKATRALQQLVELKILSHRVFRGIIGDFSDDRLSWAAKGLLLFCKENPHATLDQFSELSSQSHDDQNSLRRALYELKRYGYLEEFPQVNQIFQESNQGTPSRELQPNRS
ncbi:hypothetical protein [Alicyclobacillus dauci]|uniref:Helix-turn-helix domain-containing protein n=1 Tax=Alicyclobacillus dauci TaxID=1475485 RepID=A0ABY6Z4G2_9BACL|nr:hypothetical protein [Alicyclobacillus dauci]WAH37778.1 hypothetical protein NZD86_04545 [Alicyclobacillus dauci]